jgi:hypothetical protein
MIAVGLPSFDHSRWVKKIMYKYDKLPYYFLDTQYIVIWVSELLYL